MIKMNTHLYNYKYVGINAQHKKISGEISAISSVRAKIQLRDQGIIPTKIVKKRRFLWDRFRRKISYTDISIFSRQMATLIKAGIPLIPAFDIVAKGQTNYGLKHLITSIKQDVASGSRFADALKKYPNQFNALFCSLVEAGELSGTLDIMLDKIAHYKELMGGLKNKIKKALTYPCAVLAIALLVCIGLLVFVVPQFQALFAAFGAELPLLTRMIIGLSALVQSYWYALFALVGLGACVLSYALKHSLRCERILLHAPIIGPILRQASIASFTRTLAITSAAGLPLLDALKSVASATGSIAYSQATDKISTYLADGLPMNQAMQQTKVFPDRVLQMVAIGEESGTLDTMLASLADFYEAEVHNAVDSLSSLLEPFIMSILGILVGGLVLAMYVPIFKLGSII